MEYAKLSKEQLEKEYAAVKATYEGMKASGLSLDMSRGKPGFENTELSEDMLTAVCREKGYKNKEGIDCSVKIRKEKNRIFASGNVPGCGRCDL